MIKTINLCKKYEGFAIRHISLNIEPGYIYGFIGKNGAGKTTTIQLIMGVISPTDGEILYFNNLNSKDAKQKIGFVYENCAYYEHLSGEKMAHIISKFYRDWDNDLFLSYIDRFNLPLQNKIETYSKGMKIKYSLACALAHRPDLLILDEPTSGVDPLFRHELLEIFQEYIEDGTKSVFFSTHITSDLEKVADYIYFINNGEIILESTSDALKEQYAVIQGPKESIDQLGDLAIGTQHMKYQSKCLIKNVHPIKLNDCIISEPTFEDILIFFTKGKSHE